MPKGISIHVGVNATQARGISVPALKGCENDAREMRLLARARGFTGLAGDDDAIIVKDKATFENVLGKIRLAADALDDGDIFLFTFAGHGTSRGGNEPDGRDETIVLFDKLVIDNVLRRNLWPKFKPGVRVVMVSDSCYSGTVAMSVMDNSEDDVPLIPMCSPGDPSDQGNGNDFGVRSVPQDQAEAHIALLSDFYAELDASLPSAALEPIQAGVLLLAACKEDEKTREATINGVTHGVYTRALLNAWSSNGSKTYRQLCDAVTAQLEPNTHPVIEMVDGSPSFSETEAFKI